MNSTHLKLAVKEKYGAIASESVLMQKGGCCGTTGCCGELEINMIGDDYSGVDGHFAEADLGLGCGLPTQYAGIKPGDSVLDLGSGAGNDCFVARSLVGETGKVTGIDFTESMIEKANSNLTKTGFKNIEFIQGDIEEMPLPANTFDVVISNCVLNLVPDKQKAFSEIFRVVKPDGHFCVSDVVLAGELPFGLKDSAAMYAGCVAGALQKTEYLRIIENQGFTEIIIHKERKIELPDSVLVKFISEQEMASFKTSGAGIYSITISAVKK